MKHITKDSNKFAEINKLISRGIEGSSSHKYATEDTFNLGKENINSEEYDEIDIVGISVNGNRKNRICFDKELVKKAFDSRAILVADNTQDRNRIFNIGERNLHDFLVNELKAQYDEVTIDSGATVGRYIKK
jgi:hypothetical protein